MWQGNFDIGTSIGVVSSQHIIQVINNLGAKANHEKKCGKSAGSTISAHSQAQVLPSQISQSGNASQISQSGNASQISQPGNATLPGSQKVPFSICGQVIDYVFDIAKLSQAPAPAGLRLALFQLDPPTQPPSHPQESSLNTTKTAFATLVTSSSTFEYGSLTWHIF